jgi:hypothetical protein
MAFVFDATPVLLMKINDTKWHILTIQDQLCFGNDRNYVAIKRLIDVIYFFSSVITPLHDKWGKQAMRGAAC